MVVILTEHFYFKHTSFVLPVFVLAVNPLKDGQCSGMVVSTVALQQEPPGWLWSLPVPPSVPEFL